jgi:hypothetical protein
MYSWSQTFLVVMHKSAFFFLHTATLSSLWDVACVANWSYHSWTRWGQIDYKQFSRSNSFTPSVTCGIAHCQQQIVTGYKCRLSCCHNRQGKREASFVNAHVHIGTCGGVVVKVQRYYSDGSGIDSPWCHWIFQWYISFQLYHGPGIDSAPSENEDQEHFLGIKAAGAWGWRPYHLRVPNVMEIEEPKPPGTLWATPGLLWDSFTFLHVHISCTCQWISLKPLTS